MVDLDHSTLRWRICVSKQARTTDDGGQARGDNPVLNADDIEVGNAELTEMTGRVNPGFDTQPTAQIALCSFVAGTEGAIEHKALPTMIRSSSYGNALETGGDPADLDLIISSTIEPGGGPADLDLIGGSTSWDHGNADPTQSPNAVGLSASDGGVGTNTAERHVRDPDTLVGNVSDVAQVQTAEMGLNLLDAVDVDVTGLRAGAAFLGSTTRASNPDATGRFAGLGTEFGNRRFNLSLSCEQGHQRWYSVCAAHSRPTSRVAREPRQEPRLRCTV